MAEFDDEVVFEPLNVADFSSCADLIGKIEADYGPIAILVNAAGITRDTSLRKMNYPKG